MSSDQTATIVVAAVILYKGRILIQRKEKADSPENVGKHELSGGKVRYGEDFARALRREVKEELDLEIQVGRLLHSQVNTYSSGIDYLVLYYHCTLQVLPTSLMVDRVRFVLPSELEQYETLPGTPEAISHLGEVTTMQEGFSFVGSDVTNQTVDETLHVMTYELGKVVESYHKSKRYGATAYYNDENQRKEMSDLISMCRMYCEQRGWDYDELLKLGEEAYLERMEDLRQYGKR